MGQIKDHQGTRVPAEVDHQGLLDLMDHTEVNLDHTVVNLDHTEVNLDLTEVKQDLTKVSLDLTEVTQDLLDRTEVTQDQALDLDLTMDPTDLREAA